MTYEQCEGEIVTRAEAIREIEAHCVSPDDFFNDEGDRQEYDAHTVLHWLGY